MRFLGLLFFFASAFVFVSVFKNVHETLPQLIADVPLRNAVERCVADALLTLVGGIFAVVLAFWCITESQMRWLLKQAGKQEHAMDERVHVLERENKYKDELLGRIEALEEKSRTRSWPTP